MVRVHPTVPDRLIAELSQHLTDEPNVFAPWKIQKALQMALRMVALVRAADGRWFARKGIPKDVRDEYARLYGMRYEAQLKLSGDTPRAACRMDCRGRNADRDAARKEERRRPAAHQAQCDSSRWSMVHLVRWTARERSGPAEALAGDERSSRVERDLPGGTRKLPRELQGRSSLGMAEGARGSRSSEAAGCRVSACGDCAENWRNGCESKA